MNKILETANNAEAALLVYRWVGVVGWFFIIYGVIEGVRFLRGLHS